MLGIFLCRGGEMFTFEQKWLRVIVMAMLPEGKSEALPYGPYDLDFQAFLIHLLGEVSLKVRFGLRISVWMIHFAPLVMVFGFRTFRALAPAAQQDVLYRLSHSPVFIVRELPNLIKLVVCLGYFGHPTIQKCMGFPEVDPLPPRWVQAEEGTNE
jgi:hypothetical protein